MKKLFTFIVFSAIVLFGCTEPFTIQDTEDPDEVLVIEASITNENKFQKIFLSKAYKLSTEEEAPETNATVHIKNENNTIYLFNETTPGTYVSSSKFSAQSGVNYQLFITRATGEKYESKTEKTTSNSQIEDVSVNIDTDIEGNNEFRLYVHSNDASGASKYYRYTYEETYKIIAPYWSAFEGVVVNGRVEILPKKDLNQKICYKTNLSNRIIQAKTTNLTEDRVNTLVRRIPVTDFIVSHRYSILVKQHVQTYEAYTYYATLNKFSNASDLLSQNQPGFIPSNIHSVLDTNEKVLGFFEVTSVTEKRMFFNYRDFIDDDRPEYPEKCVTIAPPRIDDYGYEKPLINAIASGKWLYFSHNPKRDLEVYPGPYLLKPIGCGDCTKYGSNVKPLWWIE